MASAKKAWTDGEALADAPIETLPERGPKEPSANAKEVSFIITDRRYHRHATHNKAKAERAHLTAQHKKVFRILRVLNVAKERIPLYESAPEMQAVLAELVAVADDLTAWAAGPACWERTMERYRPIRERAAALIAATGGEVAEG